MLFHVKHTHTWETCPYNDPDRAKGTFGKAFELFKDSDMTVVGAWADGPAHTIFFVVDADSPAQIEQALAPVIDLGWAETRPVSDLGDILARTAGG
jgi:hypothetical protein